MTLKDENLALSDEKLAEEINKIFVTLLTAYETGKGATFVYFSKQAIQEFFNLIGPDSRLEFVSCWDDEKSIGTLYEEFIYLNEFTFVEVVFVAEKVDMCETSFGRRKSGVVSRVGMQPTKVVNVDEVKYMLINAKFFDATLKISIPAGNRFELYDANSKKSKAFNNNCYLPSSYMAYNGLMLRDVIKPFDVIGYFNRYAARFNCEEELKEFMAENGINLHGTK